MRFIKLIKIKPNSKSQILNSITGFSLIELLVTVSVVILLTSMLIVFSRTGERQLALFAERTKLLGVITEAKALTLQTLTEAEPDPPCGFGVYFDPPNNEYVLFRNGANKSTCYDMKVENIPPNYQPDPPDLRDRIVGLKHKLSKGVRFTAGDPQQMILFIPPDPTTVFYPHPGASGVMTITIETDDSQATKALIKINNFGQITF